MPAASKHLDNVIANQSRTADVRVVFLDIEKYSKRRTQSQILAIDAFTRHLRAALDEVSAKYVKYAQANDLNFETDIIRLPTGDGAALAFPFGGLPEIHLNFTQALLKHVHAGNSQGPACEKFQDQGWCHCHSHHHVRVGISEGKCIIYRDVNGGYNVAGGAMNMAARVMGLADRSQIITTEDAYKQIIDLAEDVSIADQFREYRSVEVKHGVRLNIYQFLGQDEPYINNNPPESVAAFKSMSEAMSQMRDLGLPLPSIEGADEKERMQMIQQFTGVYKKFAQGLLDLQAEFEQLKQGPQLTDDRDHASNR